MITVEEVIKHSRIREYMSGVQRNNARIKATSEVFTPTDLVNHMLDTFISQGDIADNFLDPACGDGQILSEILIRKMQAGMDFESALSTVYGVDLMEDNVALCQDRLLCGQEHLRHIVEKNIVCKNGLEYDYSFGEPSTALFEYS
jgi:type I restriction-modification system DNA methylase subunit